MILPNHIAIIPDGNRRWAKERDLMPWDGHKAGVDNFRKISRVLFKQGVVYLTFWALSIDNIKKRTPVEIEFLIGLMKEEFGDPSLIEEFMRDGIKVRMVGKWRELISDIELHKTIDDLESKTADNTKGNLTILFVYDGKTEMLEAAQKAHTDMDENGLKGKLWTGFLPSVDLVIRTGGEPHWSGGFMMWLTADSQFYFTETKWPAFEEKELSRALHDYVGRERRLGK